MGLPALLLIIFGSLPAFRKPQATLGGPTPFQDYLPILIALTLAMLGLVTLPTALVSTPLGAAVAAMHASYQGSFPSAGSLLVLAGYAVIFGYLAVRFFSWE